MALSGQRTIEDFRDFVCSLVLGTHCNAQGRGHATIAPLSGDVTLFVIPESLGRGNGLRREEAIVAQPFTASDRERFIQCERRSTTPPLSLDSKSCHLPRLVSTCILPLRPRRSTPGVSMNAGLPSSLLPRDSSCHSG